MSHLVLIQQVFIDILQIEKIQKPPVVNRGFLVSKLLTGWINSVLIHSWKRAFYNIPIQCLY